MQRKKTSPRRSKTENLRGSYLFWSVFGKVTSRLLGKCKIAFPRQVYDVLSQIMCARMVNEMSCASSFSVENGLACDHPPPPPATDPRRVRFCCLRGQRNGLPPKTTEEAFLANLLAYKIFSKSIKHIKIIWWNV